MLPVGIATANCPASPILVLRFTAEDNDALLEALQDYGDGL